MAPDDRLTNADCRLPTADCRLTTDDRRLSTAAAPRLPVDELQHDEVPMDRDTLSAPSSTRADLDIRTPDLDATADRFTNLETARGAPPDPPSSALGLGDVGQSPVLGPPTAAPAQGSAYEPACEQSRSAVWPLVLALGVGAACGFAGGYGMGIYDRPLSTSGAATAATLAGRELTEATVKEAAKAAATETPVLGETPAPTAERDVARDATGPLQPDPAGRLLVRSTPAGARVFVDGRDYGRTPVTVRDIAPGSHRVRLVRDGYGAEERRVLVSASKPSQSVTLRLSPTAAAGRVAATARAAAVAPSARERGVGTLTVESKPSGAQVFVDDRRVGATPLSLSGMAAGEHMMRLELDGYGRWSSSIRIAPGERHRVTASLEQ